MSLSNCEHAHIIGVMACVLVDQCGPLLAHNCGVFYSLLQHRICKPYRPSTMKHICQTYGYGSIEITPPTTAPKKPNGGHALVLCRYTAGVVKIDRVWAKIDRGCGSLPHSCHLLQAVPGRMARNGSGKEVRDVSDEGAPAAPSTCASRASSLRVPLWCRHSVVEQNSPTSRDTEGHRRSP